MKDITINKKLLILFLLFLFSFVLRLATINQIGRTWDESEYVEQGYKMIELMKKGDFDNSYFYTTYDHPPLVKYLYGITAHFDSENNSSDKSIHLKYDLTFSRIFSAIIFSCGVVITALIGWTFISPIVGIIAAIILAMLPFSLGLSQLVSTESFKIFIYTLGVYLYFLFLQKPSLKKLVIIGIVTGIAIQIKQSNVLLFPLFLFSSLLYCRQLIKKEKKDFFKKTARSLIVIVLLSIVMFIAIWPQLLFHAQDVYMIHSRLWHVKFSPQILQLTVSVPEVFLGRLMLTPIFYYALYFFISIPIIILFFFFAGLGTILKKKKWILYTLLIWVILPFSLSFYSWRQHGLRYLIEIYPAIALIAALGYESFIQRWVTKDYIKLLWFLPILLYLLTILWQIKPYYLDYFNEFVGGTNTVYQNRWFQQGWWGQGEREAGLYLKENAPQGSTVGLAVSPDHVFPKFDQLKYADWSRNKKYDYVVVNYYHIIRDNFDDSPIRKEYRLVYQVKADDATLVFIYQHK